MVIKFFILIFLTTFLFAQDTYDNYNEYGNTETEEYTDSYYTQDDNNAYETYQEGEYYSSYEDYLEENRGIDITRLPAYKTYNRRNLRSKNLPEMFTSRTVLENLNDTYWKLKYYHLEDVSQLKGIELYFNNSEMLVTVIGKDNHSINIKKYNLLPYQMIKPNEGIFLYITEEEKVIFCYIKLISRHMLVTKFLDTIEEAESIQYQNLSQVPIFLIY